MSQLVFRLAEASQSDLGRAVTEGQFAILHWVLPPPVQVQATFTELGH